MQAEFEFSKNYKTNDERWVEWLNVLAKMNREFYAKHPDFNLMDVFKHIDFEKELEGGVSIPLDIVLDPYDQFVFKFLKEVDKTNGWAKVGKIIYAN
jgi:hypothetical protein